MSGFDVEKFKDWQRNVVAGSLAAVAKAAKATYTSDEYVLSMMFGVGAMTATTIVRDVLEEGKLPDEMGLALTFASAFDNALEHEEIFRQAYDKAKEKEI